MRASSISPCRTYLGIDDQNPACRGRRCGGPRFLRERTIAAPRPEESALTAPPSLDQLVLRYEAPAVRDRQQDCLANAVYFESRGEPVQGQLAVADVVMNRAASGHYPADLCDVVTQKAQFSFVRRGHIPAADKDSPAWRKAVAVARIAAAKVAEAVPAGVLWYHAAYVAPSWRRGLNVKSRIGLHVFYS
jgi:spore germination cell wall hydrolase CwlJ-like protein